jgi:hypothetical protein
MVITPDVDTFLITLVYPDSGSGRAQAAYTFPVASTAIAVGMQLVSIGVTVYEGIWPNTQGPIANHARVAIVKEDTSFGRVIAATEIYPTTSGLPSPCNLSTWLYFGG